MKLNLFLLFALVTLFFLSGCSTETIFVQRTVIDGSMSTPPVHPGKNAQPGSGSFSMYCQLPNQKISTGKLESNQQDNLNSDTTLSSDMVWHHPTLTMGGDAEYYLTHQISLTGGFQYSAGNGRDNWGGRCGLGFTVPGKSTTLRLDGGIGLQSIHHTEDYVVVEEDFFSSKKTNIYLSDTRNTSESTYYVTFTLNSVDTNWVVQFLLQFGWSKQYLYDLETEAKVNVNGSRDVGSVSIFTLTPAFIIPLKQDISVICGVRASSFTTVDNLQPEFIVMPFMQMNFDF